MATCPPPPAQPADQNPALSLHSEDFYGTALVTGVLGPVLSADEADYGDTEVMLGLKSANAYLSGCSAGGTGKPDPYKMLPLGEIEQIVHRISVLFLSESCESTIISK